MKWTKNRPEKTGWYFNSDGVNVEIYRVIQTHEGPHLRWPSADGYWRWLPVSKFNGDWAGPIDLPEHQNINLNCNETLPGVTT